MRIVFSRRAQLVGHHLLHRHVHIEIVEAILQAHLARELGVRRHKLRPAGIVLVQILDDDARLRHGAVVRLVAQHREPADRPDRLECGAGFRVEQVHDQGFERRVVLVEGHQGLLAERGQGVEIELERHGKTLAVGCRGYPALLGTSMAVGSVSGVVGVMSAHLGPLWLRYRAARCRRGAVDVDRRRDDDVAFARSGMSALAGVADGTRDQAS